MPGVFVLLWSTGFIGAKYGLPYAEPLTFLLLRFVIVVALLLPVALLTRAPWPSRLVDVGHVAVTGLLVHAVYLGGVFASIDLGVPAGLAALIVGLQPLLTATLVGPLLGERVRPRQWLGFLLGLAGVFMVMAEKLVPADGGGFGDLAFQGFGLGGITLALAALVGITAGTLYQKRFCQALDLRTGTVIQYAAATVAMAVFAPLFETMRVQWTGDFVFALMWLVVVLSLGAISLLMMLIRRGEAARTAGLFYLVPPCTALVAYFLFDERLGLLALAGMAIAAAGRRIGCTALSAAFTTPTPHSAIPL